MNKEETYRLQSIDDRLSIEVSLEVYNKMLDYITTDGCAYTIIVANEYPGRIEYQDRQRFGRIEPPTKVTTTLQFKKAEYYYKMVELLLRKTEDSNS